MFAAGGARLAAMRTPILTALALAALAPPALADAYPVTGRYGESPHTEKGSIDCAGKHIVAFNDGERTESKGGVPAFRNKSVTASGAGRWRVVDQFTTGQIRNGSTTYTLHVIDADRIEMIMQSGGGTLKLQRCK